MAASSTPSKEVPGGEVYSSMDTMLLAHHGGDVCVMFMTLVLVMYKKSMIPFEVEFYITCLIITQKVSSC